MQKPIDAYNNVLELVGNTPLVKLNRIVSHIPGEHYAKVELSIRVILQKIALPSLSLKKQNARGY